MRSEKLIRTFICEENSCKKEFTLVFENEKLVGKAPEGIEDFRVVQANSGEQFGYCSGICESAAALAGKHDFVKAPKIAIASNQDAYVAQKAADKLIELRGR